MRAPRRESASRRAERSRQVGSAVAQHHLARDRGRARARPPPPPPRSSLQEEDGSVDGDVELSFAERDDRGYDSEDGRFAGGAADPWEEEGGASSSGSCWRTASVVFMFLQMVLMVVFLSVYTNATGESSEQRIDAHPKVRYQKPDPEELTKRYFGDHNLTSSLLMPEIATEVANGLEDETEAPTDTPPITVLGSTDADADAGADSGADADAAEDRVNGPDGPDGPGGGDGSGESDGSGEILEPDVSGESGGSLEDATDGAPGEEPTEAPEGPQEIIPAALAGPPEEEAADAVDAAETPQAESDPQAAAAPPPELETEDGAPVEAPEDGGEGERPGEGADYGADEELLMDEFFPGEEANNDDEGVYGGAGET